MAKILAIDTSTSACSVALLIDNSISEEFVVVPQSHTQRLLPMTDQILSRHQQRLSDLDAIALTIGPGSFTGLRIGLGIAQGLAFGADLPLIGVSSLQVMAMSAKRLIGTPIDAVIVPCFDARMNEVYWGQYQSIDSNIHCTTEDRVDAPTEMLAQIGKGAKSLLGVGDGWSVLHNDELEQFLQQFKLQNTGGEISIVAEHYPHAEDVAVLAEQKLKQGEYKPALELSPVYIRNEVSWKKRQRIRQPSN